MVVPSMTDIEIVQELAWQTEANKIGWLDGECGPNYAEINGLRVEFGSWYDSSPGSSDAPRQTYWLKAEVDDDTLRFEMRDCDKWPLGAMFEALQALANAIRTYRERAVSGGSQQTRDRLVAVLQNNCTR